jgi:two-component system aerobic respiration control sensor histidine kinase ArcB
MSETPRDPTTGGLGHNHAPGLLSRETAVIARLSDLEDQLVEQSIAYAKTNGYAPYTTTIRAAWVEAVRSLTEALDAFVADARAGPRGPQAEAKYRHDPRFARMRMIARKHRAVGITLELYLGLFKHFRRVYLDTLATIPAPPDIRAGVLDRTLDFFDETELSVIADWTDAGEDERLKELQAQSRTLTLAKDRYIAIFESLRNPACLLDRSRGLVHANRAALDLFVGEAEAGDSLYRHGRRELVARVETLLGEVIAHKAGADPTVWVQTVAGRRCFDVRLRPLHDAVENIPLGYLVQLYDVTAYREATETAQRAERQMSRFLATMSHEIRTPLHAVLGAADLMRQSEDTARDTYLDVIQGAGQSLLLTLNNVLDYSKLEYGPPTPRPADTEIGPALEAFCGLALVGPETGSAHLSLSLGPEVPPHVRIDWAMTRQVLTNLVSNALRHDRGDGVMLRVSATDGRLRFTVIDHGPGVPAEEVEALFRPFDEVSARPTVAGGTGLGLAISRYLVLAMAGTIDFDPTVQGTCIWFEIPFAPATAPDTPRAAERGPPRAAARGRCLLVDDDHIGALVTVHQLQRAGFTVDRAATLHEARLAFDAAPYDAVVVDYLLPDGIGPDLLTDLRQTGLARNTRFVALTANVEALNDAKDLGKGFSRILAKPTDTSSLADALRGCVLPPARPKGKAPGALCDGLEGLSPETVTAMAEAFRQQWSGFRAQLRRLRRGDVPDGLADTAHRLAGSSAQLGLVEIESALKALEARHDAGDTEALPDLIARLDLPLHQIGSWRRLSLGEKAP